MIRILATSDWHIDVHAWAKYPTLCGDSCHSLTQIVDYAIQLDVDAVLAAGDLSNTPNPPPGAQAHVHRQMDRLQEKSIYLLFCQGQHERNTEFARLAVHEWPTHLDRASWTHGGLRVTGFDWVPAYQLGATLDWARDDKPHVLMCHQVWTQFMGTLCETEGSLLDCPGGVVVTGDFHDHRVLDLVRPDGSPLKVFSPGSMSMRKIDENPQKAIFLLEFEDGRLVNYTSLPLKTRNVTRIVADTEGALQDILEDVDALTERDPSLPEDLQTPIVQVKYHADIPNAYDFLTQAFRNRAHLFLDVFGKQGRASAQEQSATREQLDRGLIGCTPLLGLDSSTQEIVEDLLRSPEPVGYLGTLLDSYVNEETT